MLFVYLMIVNAGSYQVIRRLDSSVLLLIATIGTLVSLSFGSFMGESTVPPFTIAWVWIANLMLFTVIMDLIKRRPDQSGAVSWAGNILYLSVILLSLVLLHHRNETSLLLCTAGAVGSIILAFRNVGWHQRVIPYAVITFSVAVIWVLGSFQPGIVSWGLLLFLIYGVFAGLGPVLLIKKYGMQKSFLYWFRVFPIAIAGLSLAAVFKEPNISFWFWPMALSLQVLGIVVSLLFGAVVQVAGLVLIPVISGLTWIIRVPSGFIGLGFYGFLLFAGAVLCMAVFFVLRKLPGWTRFLNLAKELADPKESKHGLIEWMTASPAVGGFLLLAASFMIQKHLNPHPGMATMAFHGGVLLFYISAIPVLLLDYGWIGLTLVYEASALLWLNRSVTHPGLRWVAAFMAPAGLILLFAFLPEMKNPQSPAVLNSAVLSVAAAIVSLAAAVKFSGFPDRLFRKIDLPNFFLWLALGTGFGLLNLVIADIFAGPGTSFRFLTGKNQLQAVCYILVWAGFGSILWKMGTLTEAMRKVGLTLLGLATAGLILFPFIYF